MSTQVRMAAQAPVNDERARLETELAVPAPNIEEPAGAAESREPAEKLRVLAGRIDIRHAVRIRPTVGS